MVKVTYGSTFNIIVDGSEPVDRDEVVRKCRKWLKAKFAVLRRVVLRRSGGVEPSVVVERFIESDGDSGLDDYKVFVMNGITVSRSCARGAPRPRTTRTATTWIGT